MIFIFRIFFKFNLHAKLFKDCLIKCNINQFILLEVFKINNKDSGKEPINQGKERPDHSDEIDDKSENEIDDKSKDKPEKIETCYFCLQKFDMNKDDLSHYKYGKFPMCDYCSQFYGFYDEK